MKSVWLKARWAAIPLMSWGLVACSASDDVTTQSVTPAQKMAIAEPDCGSLKAEIDKLNAAKLPEKLQQAGAKKYNPTPDEWSAFPRYNNLVETYTVKKCEPGVAAGQGGTGQDESESRRDASQDGGCRRGDGCGRQAGCGRGSGKAGRRQASCG